MAKRRAYGEIQPGIKWGPFTLRVPGVHVGITWPEVVQGSLLSLATGAAVAPLLTYLRQKSPTSKRRESGR